MDHGLIESLVATRPHPSLGAHADTYGRVIGSWTGELARFQEGKSAASASVEVHFAWVLEGRAIQDVWITPARTERRSNVNDSGLDWYGSTLRVFEPSTGAWNTTWIDPMSQLRIELVGRRQGDDIVQIGTRGGRPIRWIFSEITAASFTWRGHILSVDGVTWTPEVEMKFRRLKP
ncbi:MAG TPA: hypothetical protein VER11_02990 [Polyangiaceae bacterium]|nr:hypothetical protein [Polyangiaceae bacterium]